jgi:hypothetical protein
MQDTLPLPAIAQQFSASGDGQPDVVVLVVVDVVVVVVEEVVVVVVVVVVVAVELLAGTSRSDGFAGTKTPEPN